MRRPLVLYVVLFVVGLATYRLRHDVVEECAVCAAQRSRTDYGLYFMRWGIALKSGEPDLAPSATLVEVLDPDRHAHRWETAREVWFGLLDSERARSIRSSLRSPLGLALQDSAKWRMRTREALDDREFDLAQLETALSYFPVREDADSETHRQDYELVEERLIRRYGEHPMGEEPHYIR